ncbi:hypothetical protein PILCRDRAFT_81624 [Piloderma croceum F 1598]|uniref:Malonyl-CoA:ACP transacylase (MAT) domain-containing protein n=1 Tax=Piloderma croceum (strain F 1598) TaxID=765440 RepID=A0A0C3EYE7_PILCF|nr:hypothetical protein PILCRDRAFT_81624 [Piloderma croceum F 1598]
MWILWGLTPVVLAGHSFGEYSILVRAGVLSICDALKLVGIRAALIREKCAGVCSWTFEPADGYTSRTGVH